MICHHEDTPMLLNISGQKYVLPSNCSFLLSDASNLSPLLDYGTSPVIIIINFIYSIWLPCTYKFLYIQFDYLVLNKAVFKWLSKNQNQSNYSDQSQQEQTALWTNHNSQQLSATRSKRGKNHAYMVRFVLVLLLIGWKTGRDSFKRITKRSNRNGVITFESENCSISKKLVYCSVLSSLCDP